MLCVECVFMVFSLCACVFIWNLGVCVCVMF